MNIKHIQILSEAEANLEDGRLFYESKEQGVGEYFLRFASIGHRIFNYICWSSFQSVWLLSNAVKEVSIFNLLQFKR